MNKKTMLYCPECRKELKSNDQVTLDILYTVTHQDCTATTLASKDSGTFQQLQEKYPIFKPLSLNYTKKGTV